MAIMLITVDPKDESHLRTLYDFLEARLKEPRLNISHKELPTWEDHIAFVKSEPYSAWYLIYLQCNDNPIGAVYLTKGDEIGIWLNPAIRGNGLGRQAITMLMMIQPRPRYLANINPKNIDSQRFFREKFNAAEIQLTMEISNVDRR